MTQIITIKNNRKDKILTFKLVLPTGQGVNNERKEPCREAKIICETLEWLVDTIYSKEDL